MNKKLKTFLIWFFAFIFTAAIAVYQRMTGPTYPVAGKVELGSQKIAYKLPTSYGGSDDAPVFINVPDRSVSGELTYKRFKSNDSLTTVNMKRVGDWLVTFIPHQPPAGKVIYRIMLFNINPDPEHDNVVQLIEKDVVIRFKGSVPAAFLIPHILFIFLAMMLSTVTGIEAIMKGKNTRMYTWWTIITLLIGGLILGPVIQKYSFGAYWTGWPFGHDLTDNKSLVAFIFWVIALIVQYRNRKNRTWPVIASIVMLIVFLIPHSVLGSEIDYSKEQTSVVHGN
jgi:hypothetical protein